MTDYTRRRFLQLAGFTGMLGVAGCSSRTQQTATDVPADTPIGSSTNTPTASSTNTRTSGTESPTQTVTETKTQTPTSEVTDWPQFQFDAHNSGHNPNGTGPKENISVKWQFNIGTPVQTAPVLQNGTVYVNADQLYALSAGDGSVEWTFAPSGRGTTPAVAGNLVYVGGSGDTIYALNKRDGSEEWRAHLGNDLSAPTVKPPRVFIGSREGGTTAFDAESGENLWQTAGSRSFAPPVVSNGVMYLAGGDFGLEGYDVGDGSTQVGGLPNFYDIRFPLTLIGNQIYTVKRDQIVIYSTSKNGKNGGITMGVPILVSPAAAAETLYLSLRDNTTQAITMDGRTRWSFETGADSESAPALVDDVLYFGSNDRNVYALDATTGDELWSFKTGRIVKSPPAVADGTVYVGSDDGNLYALHEG